MNTLIEKFNSQNGKTVKGIIALIVWQVASKYDLDALAESIPVLTDIPFDKIVTEGSFYLMELYGGVGIMDKIRKYLTGHPVFNPPAPPPAK